ncbi:DnaJ-class molecular chaperone with C-terminal Zn finger domain [Rivularia sp. PCC 7116]|uniref:J domain-containing protein n=1 Tax=Rivularia sp. PCC 7116 TaxID=373994 RepID=UPI00029EF5B4|nr:DnaJ domain-containing protein [Rivularia sp. PCC 7116]AFY55761.1 DnaJ-class molecular chaperone with C-terminal Zn finger domain [Rivularia sp. PCC 7116]
MDLLDCYRLLGLRSGASFPDIKSSYRRLAQQYHPDINPDDDRAKEKFIAVTEAYKLLLQVIPPPENNSHKKASQAVETPPKEPKRAKEKWQQKTREVQRQASPQKPKQQPTQPKPPHVAEIEQRLKWKTYEQLQQFLKQRRFPQAIALAEALVERLPHDAEVRQWLAISYQLWGRALIAEKQLLKARIFLKKALKTDPKNKSLINEVQRDFKKLEQVF